MHSELVMCAPSQPFQLFNPVLLLSSGISEAIMAAQQWDRSRFPKSTAEPFTCF